jgi:hypothetical protein
VLKLAADGVAADRVVAFHPPLRFRTEDPLEDAVIATAIERRPTGETRFPP